MGTSKLMILVPLIYLTFLKGIRRNWRRKFKWPALVCANIRKTLDATISSYGLPRQSAITGLIEAWRGQDPRKEEQTLCRLRCRKENYATIRNYLAMELRYMDAGEKAQSA